MTEDQIRDTFCFDDVKSDRPFKVTEFEQIRAQHDGNRRGGRERSSPTSRLRAIYAHVHGHAATRAGRLGQDAVAGADSRRVN